MKTICVFPKGYDPMVANGPPTNDIIKLGITWTEEETNRHRLMELDAVEMVIDGPWPIGSWSIEMTKDEYLKSRNENT